VVVICDAFFYWAATGASGLDLLDARLSIEFWGIALLELALIVTNTSDRFSPVALQLTKMNLEQSSQTILLTERRLGTTF